MKVFRLVLAMVVLFGTFNCSIAGEALPVVSEFALFEEIPIVTTPSKSEKTVLDTPSVITIWTRADIQKMGIRSIKELLERTVGFFSSFQYAGPIIGARGLIADGNEAFLFLIDGHNINTIAGGGSGSYYTFPNLAKVKRVEIIRGPGSTLWGADAALAIINIITLDGSDINGVEVSAEYATEDKMRSASIVYGKQYSEDVDVMVSFCWSEIFGFPGNDGSPNVFPSNYKSAGYYDTWWGSNTNEGGRAVGPLFALEDTWELHAKANVGDFFIAAHASDVMGSDLWRRFSDRDNMFFQRKRITYLEVGHTSDLTDTTSLQAKVFSDFIYYSPHMYTQTTAPSASSNSEENQTKTQNLGLDLMLTSQYFSAHNFKLGLQYVQTEVDPAITYQNLTYTSGVVYGRAIPEEEDRTLAVFLEDDWSVTDSLTFIAGVRADDNNLREDKTVIMPRFAAIYSIDECWGVKYLYNTGYVRPPVLVGYLGATPTKVADDGINPYLEVGADESERIIQHDIQLLYMSPGIEVSLTFYQTELDNYFNYSGKYITDNGDVSGNIISADGELYRLGTVNANDITSRGVEFDFRISVLENLVIYANYSHVFTSKTDSFEWITDGFVDTLEGSAMFSGDKTLNGFPHDMWNIGANYSVMDGQIVMNLHYRGWADMMTLADATASAVFYEKLGPEHFVDFNVVFRQLTSRPLDVSVYVKNLLDNDDSQIGFMPHGGYWTDRARSFGVKISYRF